MALRGLFIIDKQGVIQHATVNNLGIGRSVEETLRTLQVISQLNRIDINSEREWVRTKRS